MACLTYNDLSHWMRINHYYSPALIREVQQQIRLGRGETISYYFICNNRVWEKMTGT